MLLCMDKKLHFIDDQCIRLRKAIDDKEYYFYLDSYMYTQAVILKERFNFASDLGEKLGLNNLNNVFVSTSTFKEQAPEELEMFAPFVGLIAKLTDTEITDIVKQCGYLHQLARFIDFAAYASAHTDIQKSIKKYMSNLGDYEESYNNIIAKYTMDSVEYENVSIKAVREILGELVVQGGTALAVSTPQLKIAESEEEESTKNPEIDLNDPFAAFAALAAEFAEEDGDAGVSEKSDEVSVESGNQTPTAEEPVTEEEPVEEEMSKEDKALEDVLRKMGGL